MREVLNGRLKGGLIGKGTARARQKGDGMEEANGRERQW